MTEDCKKLNTLLHDKDVKTQLQSLSNTELRVIMWLCAKELKSRTEKEKIHA